MFSSRSEWLVLFLLMLAGGLGVAVPRFDGSGGSDPEIAQPETETTQPDTETAQPDTEESAEIEETAEIQPPSVDTMRFDGTTGVVAGMAAPNSDIVIRENGNEIARGKADANGNFAMTFDYQTPEEGAILQLSQIDADGVETAALEALSVMPLSDGGTQTATLTEEGVEVDAPQATQLALGKMSYGSVNTPWLLQGNAVPNSNVDIFVNGKKIGSTTTDENGVWNYEGTGVQPGTYELGLSENGGAPITQSITLEAEGATSSGNSTGGQTVQIGDKFYVVRRGDSLWRIAERFYGEGQGARYTEIFDVNANQINDPNLIYPDQKFDVPGAN